MKTYIDDRSYELKIWKEKGEEITASQIKAKIAAYKELFGECEVFVEGTFYAWINGVESPDYSINLSMPEKVIAVGYKYITIEYSQNGITYRDKVCPNDGTDEYDGAYKIIIRRKDK